MSHETPDFGVLHGVRATREGLAAYIETFENFHVEAEVTNHMFHAWRFRDGRVVWVSGHQTRQRALEAAGLPEETPHGDEDPEPGD